MAWNRRALVTAALGLLLGACVPSGTSSYALLRRPD
jgi:hypothetical protein